MKSKAKGKGRKGLIEGNVNNEDLTPIAPIATIANIINKLTATGENKEIIMSIISLANSLNLNVIAEGVEMNHQLSRVKELHCRYGQGFLFSEPKEAKAIDRWIKAENMFSGE